jgi:hypothetical protein
MIYETRTDPGLLDGRTSGQQDHERDAGGHNGKSRHDRTQRRTRISRDRIKGQIDPRMTEGGSKQK